MASRVPTPVLEIRKKKRRSIRGRLSLNPPPISESDDGAHASSGAGAAAPTDLNLDTQLRVLRHGIQLDKAYLQRLIDEDEQWHRMVADKEAEYKSVRNKHVDIVTTGGQQALLEFERLIDEETAVYRQTVSRAIETLNTKLAAKRERELRRKQRNLPDDLVDIANSLFGDDEIDARAVLASWRRSNQFYRNALAPY